MVLQKLCRLLHSVLVRERRQDFSRLDVARAVEEITIVMRHQRALSLLAAKNPRGQIQGLARQLLRRAMDRGFRVRDRSGPIRVDLSPVVAATKRRLSTVANRKAIVTLREELRR
jgi:hypothetical protein